MAQWLKALAPLPEDPGSIPSTHVKTPVCEDLGIHSEFYTSQCYTDPLSHNSSNIAMAKTFLSSSPVAQEIAPKN